MIPAAFVKPEHDRVEAIHHNSDDFKKEEDSACMIKDPVENILTFQICNDIPCPHPDGSCHCNKIDSCVCKLQGGQPVCVQYPSQSVSNVVRQNAQQKTAVISPRLCELPADMAPQYVSINDEKNDCRQYPND